MSEPLIDDDGEWVEPLRNPELESEEDQDYRNGLAPDSD